jgi:hypothetical protein
MQGLNTWESRQGQAAWDRKEGNLDLFAVTSASSYLLTKKTREIGCAAAKKPVNQFAMQKAFYREKERRESSENQGGRGYANMNSGEGKRKIKWEPL